ncbi:MAG: M24 family metallopeptidase [Deltaproteobacteria bacterium]|nr:M24 family metallopeptidase [Deltaproteobacteria bacterium]
MAPNRNPPARWEAIRRIMAKPQWNLDAILAPSSSDMAYPRYLTQIGGRGGSADVIFPRDAAKPVHAYTGSGRNKSFWSKRLTSWTADGNLKIEDDEGSKPVIAGLKALGLDRAGTRIGVAKLTGSRFDPEGRVPVAFLENLKAALPGVTFVSIEKWGSDPGPIDEPAMVKSAEELDAVRCSAAAAEKAVETIVRVARAPAKTQADIWFPTYMAMFAETGEDPIRLSISLDEASNSTLGAPVDDPLKPGQIISQEIDASAQGYRAQVNHSIFVGGPSTPGFSYYKAAMEAAIGILQESLAFVIPGKTTCGQLVDHYAALVSKANADDRSGVVLHGSGISNLSRPRLGPSNSRGDADIHLVPGMAFDFKPALRLKRSASEDIGRENRVVQIGEHYLITDNGVLRLGRRELKPIATETA